jgi:ubiquinone/menaquinone biosynthesis C-methylase UbiE
MRESSEIEDRWQGPEPLANPLEVARLGEIYSRTAAFYDGLVAQYQAKAKLMALELLARRRGERVLEVGVGTGWAFERLVTETGAAGAYGLDVAAGMLAVARQRAGGESWALLQGDGRALPFPEGTFDCLLTTYTFEVLPQEDIRPVILECLRVLRPGGRLAAVNLTEGEGEDALMTEDWKRRYPVDPEFFGGARPLQLQPMLEASGFESVTRHYVGPEWPSEVLVGFRPPSTP